MNVISGSGTAINVQNSLIHADFRRKMRPLFMKRKTIVKVLSTMVGLGTQDSEGINIYPVSFN
jgi:hypothetical protein